MEAVKSAIRGDEKATTRVATSSGADGGRGAVPVVMASMTSARATLGLSLGIAQFRNVNCSARVLLG